MKPDGVGEDERAPPPGALTSRAAGSSVTNSRSAVSAPAPASRFSSVDLPALV